MPIYEYWCSTCSERVEIFIRGNASPICPSCEGEGLERMLSLPHVQSETTRTLAREKAKKQAASQSEAQQKERETYEPDHHHNH